jgi:hypothetical protein
MDTLSAFLHLSDREFVAAFEACSFPPGDFHHAGHVRLARIYLRALGEAGAQQKMVDGISKLAVHAGSPKKFHYTATVAWVRLVAAAVAQDSSAIPFEEWIAGFPELTDKDLLSLHYSRERFSSEQARTSWVKPDLCPLRGM